jgi:hypothetical protein
LASRRRSPALPACTISSAWTSERHYARDRAGTPASTRTALDAAAKKLQKSKADLKAIETLPEHLALFVDLETRLLEMLDHPFGELGAHLIVTPNP